MAKLNEELKTIMDEMCKSCSLQVFKVKVVKDIEVDRVVGKRWSFKEWIKNIDNSYWGYGSFWERLYYSNGYEEVLEPFVLKKDSIWHLFELAIISWKVPFILSKNRYFKDTMKCYCSIFSVGENRTIFERVD